MPEGPFDLAVTHFFLDVLTCRGRKAVILQRERATFARRLLAGERVSRAARGLRRLHARLWLRAMYSFFALTTGLGASKLPPYRDVLVRYGFKEIEHRERRLGLIRSQVWRKS